MELVQDSITKRILELLQREGTQAWLSGGYVRDWLRGLSSQDVDLTVVSGAIGLARRIADQTAGAFYVLDENTDAARVLCPGQTDLVVDVAALRGPDIESDLRERDFTINAMAVDVRQRGEPHPEVVDPCEGRHDLTMRMLRATSGHAFEQDPLRMLRAVRFVATLGFRIEPCTESWIERDADMICQSSAERVRQELAIILAADQAADHLHDMDRLGLLSHILPEVTALRGVMQPEPHVHDAYEHSLATVEATERLTAARAACLSPLEAEYLGPFAMELERHFAVDTCEKRNRRTLLKLAALLHDVGKPAMRTAEPGGRVRFFGHEGPSGEIATQVLSRLRFSALETRRVAVTVGNHMRPGFLVKEPPLTHRAIYRFFRDCRDAGVDVLLLSLADHLAARGSRLLVDHYRDHLQVVSLMLEAYWRKRTEIVSPQPLVTGADVMQALGVGPGPQVGQLLEASREAQAEGLVSSKAEALEYLRGLAC
jgi:tRNA nucleotidyltransferase/poly(A) polymerase